MQESINISVYGILNTNLRLYCLNKLQFCSSYLLKPLTFYLKTCLSIIIQLFTSFWKVFFKFHWQDKTLTTGQLGRNDVSQLWTLVAFTQSFTTFSLVNILAGNSIMPIWKEKAEKTLKKCMLVHTKDSS